MYVTKHKDALEYQAPGHHNMRMYRIQGQEVSPLNGVWSARLELEPSGYVVAKASPAAKLYIVERGTIEFSVNLETVRIQAGDSVFVLPGEERSFKEVNNSQAVMYLVMLENYS